jgi:Outer membrane protein beta-barrel domain
MNSLARFFIAALLLLVTSAQAGGLLLEPYAGYAMSTTKFKVKSSGTNVSTTDDGLAVGARVGWAFPMGVWIAGEYMLVPETAQKYKEPSSTADGKVSHDAIFLDVGVDLMVIPLRFWAGYGFQENTKVTAANATSSTDFTGTAIKVGAGYKVIPFLSLNLEYMMHTLDKYKTPNTNGDVSTIYDEVNASTLMVSLSVPFSPMGK